MSCEVEKWGYNADEVVTRIPSLVGQVWENGYRVELGPMTCVKATSCFDGSHHGRGRGAEVLLARDEVGGYLLIRRK